MSIPMESELKGFVDDKVDEMAGPSLPARIAKLYGQHTRLSNRQKGLTNWSSAESASRLEDAVNLVELGFLELASEDFQRSRHAFLRAAEIFEWLNHPKIVTEKFPFNLVAGALYQVAGYPARGSAILRQTDEVGTTSKILSAFLKCDFQLTLSLLADFWIVIEAEESRDALREFSPDQAVIKNVARAIGIICAELRWGDETRARLAIEKLEGSAIVAAYGEDRLAWVLAKLVSYTARSYLQKAFRKALAPLMTDGHEHKKFAFERYIRQTYLSGKSLVWPSQEIGIQKINEHKSFALCTPTGSGKTTVAEIAIIDALFGVGVGGELIFGQQVAPIVLYITPSRALAREVEAKLAAVLGKLERGEVVVTGLYGGNDWGPTDAWINNSEKTVLICTFEKAEALVRFLGPLFINRIGLVILDEAHYVQSDGNDQKLIENDSRALRLEALGMRLLGHLRNTGCSFVALSAVASEIQGSLARWMEGEESAGALVNDYRSTRQLVGRLECLTGNSFRIEYDVLDGRNLRFADGGDNIAPFILDPFPAHPTQEAWRNDLEEKGFYTTQRPFLFWAALNLARPNEFGKRGAVLIFVSVMKWIHGYAEDFLKLIENEWSTKLPEYFEMPTTGQDKIAYAECLEVCADYFGIESIEYLLLKKGIVLHHGKMPGKMGKLLVALIERRVVNVVLATSTLSDGINLPFETVLITSVSRGRERISLREFKNLIGRAGRPGYGIEGKSLVVLSNDWKSRKDYEELIKEFSQTSPQSASGVAELIASSPLQRLLNAIQAKWLEAFPTEDNRGFIVWLETNMPIDEESGKDAEVERALDTLDGVLISIIGDVERLNAEMEGRVTVEEALKNYWQKSFAAASRAFTEMSEVIFIKRGVAVSTMLEERGIKAKVYSTGLTPVDGMKLIGMLDSLKSQVGIGFEYSSWDSETRINFLFEICQLLGEHRLFKLLGKRKKVKKELLDEDRLMFFWWLDPDKAILKPTKAQVSSWYDHISKYFIYKTSWALGCFIGAIFEESDQNFLGVSSLDSWPLTGMPWFLFWMKELLNWGTHEPVAAYLLSKGLVTARKQALTEAEKYYEYIRNEVPGIDSNDVLNPTFIRDWSILAFGDGREPRRRLPRKKFEVVLGREASDFWNLEFRVVPKVTETHIEWFDVAGFKVADMSIVNGVNVDASWVREFDFKLDVEKSLVSGEPYF